MINIGSNRFDCPIPLIFRTRYFLLERIGDADVFTVFTLHEGKPVVEVLRNEPQDNPLTTTESNPTGIITVSDPGTGEFLYKIRPGSKTSSIFGRIRDAEEEIQISDRDISYRGSVFAQNVFMGIPVGIHIREDGSIAIGTQFPPEFQQLVSRAT